MNKGIALLNANIVTSTKVFSGDILIENGKIAKIGSNLNAERNIDCSGKYILPGGVDVHTHFDLDAGTARASDDFKSGSIAAAFGGTTTIVDHLAFGPPGCSILHQPQKYFDLAKNSVIDYSFHAVSQHFDETVSCELEKLVELGITSVKAYMTYDYALDDYQMFKLMKRCKELDITLCVHAENNGLLRAVRDDFRRKNKLSPVLHGKSRPAEAEAEAISRFLWLAKVAKNPKVHIVHVSTADGLKQIEYARARGQTNITAETCPQYLFLDESLYCGTDEEALKFTFSPPLRSKMNSDYIWKDIAGCDKHQIDLIATDHCPFFVKDKMSGINDFTKCPNGIPGVELRLPLLLSSAFEGRLALTDVVKLCCTNPAKIFDLARKGNIIPGFDADLAVFERVNGFKITKKLLHENVDYTPYEGLSLNCKPSMTISRGEVLVDNGNFLGQTGRGKFIKR